MRNILQYCVSKVVIVVSEAFANVLCAIGSPKSENTSNGTGCKNEARQMVAKSVVGVWIKDQC